MPHMLLVFCDCKPAIAGFEDLELPGLFAGTCCVLGVDVDSTVLLGVVYAMTYGTILRVATCGAVSEIETCGIVPTVEGTANDPYFLHLICHHKSQF